MASRITPEQNGVWALRTTIRKEAVREPATRTYVPPFTVDGEFTSRYIAAGLKVAYARENWRFGGFFAQEFNFGASGFTSEGKAFYRTEELIINEVNFIQLPLTSDAPYKLRYFPPDWFHVMELTIWEYTGEVLDDDVIARQKLDELREVVDDFIEKDEESTLEKLLPDLFKELEDARDLYRQLVQGIQFVSIQRKLDRLIDCLDCTDAVANLPSANAEFQANTDTDNIALSYFQGFL